MGYSVRRANKGNPKPYQLTALSFYTWGITNWREWQTVASKWLSETEAQAVYKLTNADLTLEERQVVVQKYLPGVDFTEKAKTDGRRRLAVVSRLDQCERDHCA